jgi:hypothetical protein
MKAGAKTFQIRKIAILKKNVLAFPLTQACFLHRHFLEMTLLQDEIFASIIAIVTAFEESTFEKQFFF